MIRSFFCAILLVLVVVNSASAQDLETYEQEAEQVLQRLRQAMMQEMQKAMRIGAKQAIGVCRHLAPEIEDRIEKETGWQIRRTGLRVRNPENSPDARERGIMMGYELRAMAGQGPELLRSVDVVDRDGKRSIHFIQAIPTFGGCLACHGKQIAPVVMAEIRQLYPHDQASGYEVGDIRGAFSLYKIIDPIVELKVQNGSGEWDRIAALDLPTAIDLEDNGKTGNAPRGRTLFGTHCKICHSPIHLADQYFGPGKLPAQTSICVKLQTHGITDEARDCDIVAFLKALSTVENSK